MEVLGGYYEYFLLFSLHKCGIIHYKHGQKKTFCNDTKLNVQAKCGIQRKYFETKILYDFMSFVCEDI